MDARADSDDNRGVIEFGRYLRRLRRARGMTQERLAELSGLSADTIRRLEHGVFSPSLETIRKVCDGLSLTLSTLFTCYELAERDGASEVMDMLANRSPREYRIAVLVLRTLFDEFEDPLVDLDDEPREGEGPSSEPSNDDHPRDDEPSSDP